MARDPAQVPSALQLDGEVDYYRSLSFAERAELLIAVCRAGAELLASRPDAERIASFVDPLPESTVRALARLRAEHRAKRGRGAG
jgi:hypothetical protein